MEEAQMSLPAYQRIADDIRRKIEDGNLRVGDRLDTAAELAKQWKVSGAVVTQALGALKAEGLVTSAPARGTFVLPPRKRLTWSLSDFEGKQRPDTYWADAWAVGIEKQGMRPSSTVGVRRVQATNEIADWLSIEAGSTVVVRDRIRYVDDQPYMISTSYFPIWVAAGTRLEEPGDQAAPGGLLAEAGHPQARLVDTMSAPVASGEEARNLQVPQGSRVWSVLRIGFDADERPVRAMRTIAPLDLWQLEFGQPVASSVQSPFLSSSYSAAPYPGERPNRSFVELDGAGWVVAPSQDASSGWTVTTGPNQKSDLDVWLGRQGALKTDQRLPVLAYGSNASPGKISWIRETLGLSGPVVSLLADIDGVSAVWSAGKRERDGQRPAVLAATPGRTESHAIWLVTPEQRQILDQVEGRGERYRLAWVHAPVSLENGRQWEWVLAYVAGPDAYAVDLSEHLNRAPLLVDGEMVRVEDKTQNEVRNMVGASAGSDGLNLLEVSGEPSWSDVPASV